MLGQLEPKLMLVYTNYEHNPIPSYVSQHMHKMHINQMYSIKIDFVVSGYESSVFHNLKISYAFTYILIHIEQIWSLYYMNIFYFKKLTKCTI